MIISIIWHPKKKRYGFRMTLLTILLYQIVYTVRDRRFLKEGHQWLVRLCTNPRHHEWIGPDNRSKLCLNPGNRELFDKFDKWWANDRVGSEVNRSSEIRMSPKLTPEVTLRLHLGRCSGSPLSTFKGMLFGLAKNGFTQKLISTQVGFQDGLSRDRRLIEMQFWYDLVNLWRGLSAMPKEFTLDRCVHGRFFWIKEDDLLLRDTIQRRFSFLNGQADVGRQGDKCLITLVSRPGNEVTSDKFIFFWRRKRQGIKYSFD